MAKNVYAVTYQVEVIHTKKDDKGKPVIVRRGHGGEFTESVIASSPEAASSYVRTKHTSSAQNVLRSTAHLVLANVDAIPDAEPEPHEENQAGEESQGEGEDSSLEAGDEGQSE